MTYAYQDEEDADGIIYHALDFIKTYVLHPPAPPTTPTDAPTVNDEDPPTNYVGKQVENAEEAKRIAYQFSTGLRKAIFGILHEHVPTLHLKGSSGPKDLSAWLQQPNSRRNFFFLQVIRSKGCNRSKGNST